MKEAVIALGSNLFDREKNLKTAINSLNKLPETSLIQISSIYETKPFQVPDAQNNYLNCCVKINTNLSPEMLMGACLGIESAMGRKRPYKNASRIIDLDLLLYQDVTVCNKFLTLPHPKIKERAFVMIPLTDLYKDQTALNFDFSQDLISITDTTDVEFWKSLNICDFI